MLVHTKKIRLSTGFSLWTCGPNWIIFVCSNFDYFKDYKSTFPLCTETFTQGISLIHCDNLLSNAECSNKEISFPSSLLKGCRYQLGRELWENVP